MNYLLASQYFAPLSIQLLFIFYLEFYNQEFEKCIRHDKDEESVVEYDNDENSEKYDIDLQDMDLLPSLETILKG